VGVEDNSDLEKRTSFVCCHSSKQKCSFGMLIDLSDKISFGIEENMNRKCSGDLYLMQL
jgi:hypothetical protein